MKKISFKLVAIFLLSIVLCFAVPQLAQSSTVVTIQPGGTFIDIASFDFTITSSAIANDFTVATGIGSAIPTTWTIFRGTGKIVSAFDPDGGVSLTAGTLGSFASDTTLGNWHFGNQSAVDYVQGVNFFVTQNGTNYLISGTAVPIPAAVWLLGSGLVGLVALRRRMRK